MREGFYEIVSGWTLIDGIEDLTDRIERAAAWTVSNGPLEEDEKSTVEMMIQAQVARGMPEFFERVRGAMEWAIEEPRMSELTTRDIIVHDLHGVPQPAHLQVCSCGCQFWVVYLIKGHPHLQCAECGECYCTGSCDEDDR